jgi:hypothetical protein
MTNLEYYIQQYTCENFRPVYGYEDEDFRACFVDVISKSNDPDKEACDQYEENDK